MTHKNLILYIYYYAKPENWYMAISGNQLLLVLHQKTATAILFTV